MFCVYRYRLYPTRAQEAALRETTERLRELYNAALQERRDAYRVTGESPRYYAQCAELRDVREMRPEYAQMHIHLLQDALIRLDRAYGAFFDRCNSRKKPGYPRFKGRGRYRTFTFKDAGKNNGAAIVSGGKRVRLSGIGNVKIKMHRPYEGRLKQISVTLDGDGHWYAALICDDVPTKPLPKTGKSVGIDVGIKQFATFSDGSDPIENPRPLEARQTKLREAQRRASHHRRGSKQRRKANVLLAKHHARIVNARKDFHHKTALDILRRYDHISVEHLNVQGLASGMLARPINDAAFGQFFTILTAKAESAGRTIVRVDPRGTSQECSGCGEIVQKDLSVRVHDCPHCGLVLDRDVNAAINIERRGHRRGRDAEVCV